MGHKMKRSTAWMVVLCVLVAATAGCKPGEPKSAEAKEGQSAPRVGAKAVAVEIATISPSVFVQRLEFPGIAEAIEERTIAAELGGRVLEAPFEETETIKKGALVLRVDTQTSAAQISLLQSQERSAAREFARIKQLAAEGLATPQQLDQAQSGLEQARLSIKQAQLGVSKGVVYTPFGGVVVRKFVDKGEFVGPGAPVVRIMDYDTIVLRVTVPESALPYVRLGEEVDVTFPATGQQARGRIKRVGVVVVQPTQTFPVEVHIPNADHKLLPGMRAVVQLVKSRMQDVLVVERDAILEGVVRREAMVVTGLNAEGLGTAALRVVELGAAQGNEVVVTSGLQAGDKLIVRGHRSLVDGTPVRVVREVTAPTQAAPAALSPVAPEQGEEGK
jgi:membrane fusion protein (multidrug efflux system)